jgi:hypothetical protein
LFFFFKFHFSALGWLKIKLYNLFWFIFYEVILVLWSRSWIWWVNSVFLNWFFFNFII